MEKIKSQKKLFTAGLITFGFLLIGLSVLLTIRIIGPTKVRWNFQSIDTMKYSRDLAREKLGDKSFDAIIDRQISAIAATGATHVAIATPYDEEFFPILKRWVEQARRNNLNVWFRGNFSGWEGWFEYGKITREQHMEMTKAFIEKHKDIFVDGDVFTACPECENGGPGDPRLTGDVSGHRTFLIDEYFSTRAEFIKINKKVASNYDSMNFDVAKLVMDRNTTESLGGIVTIDHYVKNPEDLNKDINYIADKSGGKIVVGEFGAPIPDINGSLNESEQAAWLSNTLKLLAVNTNVIGVNYWVNEGGTTELWGSMGVPKKATAVIKKFYKKE